MKLCTCFCHGLEICTCFGYNPWINFCHFFHFVNFGHFWPQILWKCIDSGYLISATPYTISCLSLCNFAHLFFHGLKMCMWFGFNPAVNFCHFSTLLTLSVFAGATSTSPKFDLFLLFIHCRTCFSMGDLGMQVSVRSFVRPFIRLFVRQFDHPSTFTLVVLWVQLLLQFCTDFFETLHVFSSWYEDVHVVQM